MRQNYLLTLFGAFILTLFSCEKSELATESASILDTDVKSTAYSDYCKSYCDYNCNTYCEHDCDYHDKYYCDKYCDYDCDKYCEHKCDNHKGCTLTQGYWKNHYEVWDTEISGLYLGNVFYTTAELLQILRTPVRGNGLISLAHQLIAAKLNIWRGASDNEIDDVIDDADDLIGNRDILDGGSLSPSQTSSLVNALSAYNEGDIGPGHCSE